MQSMPHARLLHEQVEVSQEVRFGEQRPSHEFMQATRAAVEIGPRREFSLLIVRLRKLGSLSRACCGERFDWS